MFTITKKRNLLIAAAIALVLIAAVPYAAFASPSPSTADSNLVGATRTIIAKGIANQIINNENVTTPANFTLTLERLSGSSTVPKFSVTGGTAVVNDTVYTITSGNGGVLRGRHAILLQAQGTGPDGQAVTLKLAGRYFWMGGHLYVIRMAGKLLTNNGNSTLLMRAAIRV